MNDTPLNHRQIQVQDNMTTLDRIRYALTSVKDDVFLRSDFSPFGGTRQVSRTLSKLIECGELVKLGLGVYARAKPSVLTGQPIPVGPLEVLMPQVLEKFGIEALPSIKVEEYNLGISNQVPAGIAFRIEGRRIRRKLGFNGKLVTLEFT